MHAEAKRLLNRFAIDIDVRQPLEIYSTAVQQMLAAASSADAANDASRAQAPEWLQTKALNRRGHVKAMDLGIRRGEVVGLGGLLWRGHLHGGGQGAV
eukprot:gene24002-24062_t